MRKMTLQDLGQAVVDVAKSLVAEGKTGLGSAARTIFAKAVKACPEPRKATRLLEGSRRWKADPGKAGRKVGS